MHSASIFQLLRAEWTEGVMDIVSDRKLGSLDTHKIFVITFPTL
jgi:hypothetical protein